MTRKRAGLFILALLGVVVPFELANFLLKRLYRPEVTGLPAPLCPSLFLYTVALLVASYVVYICYLGILKDSEPTDKKDGLDDAEELPY